MMRPSSIYKPAIGGLFIILIALPATMALTVSIINPADVFAGASTWMRWIPAALFAAYAVAAYFGTYYSIDRDVLTARFAWICRRSVPIANIQSIEDGRRTHYTYSLTWKGMAIKTKGGNCLIVGPRNPEKFVAEIQSVNPEVVVGIRDKD